MYLSKGGITYQDAMNMAADERLMWSLVLGEIHGLKLNEISGRFEKVPEKPEQPRILRP